MAKIALVHNHVGGTAGGGGGVRLMVEMGLALERQGHRVTIACHNFDANAEFAEATKRLDIRSVHEGDAGHPVGQRAMAERYWRGMPKVARLVPDDVDVVNAHEWPGLRAGLLASRRIGRPFVWTRNDESIFERAIVPGDTILGGPGLISRVRNGLLGIPDLLAGRAAASVVVLSTGQARMVERSFRRPARVVPLGPAERFFAAPDRAEARARLGIPEDAFLAVGASILFRHRRFEDLVEAAALLKDDPRLHVLIAGSDFADRDYADELDALIRARGLEGRVTMPRAALSEEELTDVYAAGDVFVYPNQRQTWGLAPLEALAAGTPAIVSSGAGVHEVLVGRPGVRIVPPEEPHAIADAIRASMADDDRAGAAETREWIRSELSVDRYAEQMAAIFDEAAGGSRNPAASGGLVKTVDDRNGSMPGRLKQASTRLRLGVRERMPEMVTIDVADPPYRYLCESAEEYQRAVSLTWKEPGTFKFLHEDLQAGDVFYDIGANMGIYTVPAAHTVGERGRVFAFEPHVGNVRSLLQNVGANRLGDRVSVISSALHERSGFFDFNYSDWTPGTALSQLDGDRDPFGKDLNAVGSELKYATTVDQLIADGVIQPATMIKIDVDGNELPILRGMRGLLVGPDRPRALQVEVNPEDRTELLGFMAEVGYELADRHYTEGAERMLRAGDDPDSVPYNAIFR
jgi:FkbM family methyltransferase